MDSHSLRYFLVTAREQHMTRAAEKLNMTQPSLSASIKRLENEVGYTLFDRTSRGVALNEYGRVFASGAQSAMDALDTALMNMKRLERQSKQATSLACSLSVSTQPLISRLIEEFEHLSVFEISDDWEQRLVEEKLDIVITLAKPTSPLIKCSPLGKEHVVVLAGTRHPLAGKEHILVSDLDRFEFASVNSPTSVTTVMTSDGHPHTFSPLVTFMGRDINDQLCAVRTGKYLCLTFEPNAEHYAEQDNNLVALDVEGLDIEMTRYLHLKSHPHRNVDLDPILEVVRTYFASRS